ncbi:MAG: hypothetical protein CL535_14270 [Ahrensia sp.]|nr:hypothetical protein [Ahrensia sp.]|tara:strand:- start:7779 stop:8630 length:852 start_codon:yes stop_codon:yes gene_type:complete
MAENEFDLSARKKLTFGQAEGRDALPAQLALKEVSVALKADLWDLFLSRLQADRGEMGYLSGTSAKVMRRHWVEVRHKMADEWDPKLSANIDVLKGYFRSSDYVDVLGTTQWLLRAYKQSNLANLVEYKLVKHHAAYRLIDGDTIIPIASEEDGKTVLRALDVLSESHNHGGRKHLVEAASRLTQGDYAGSVRESTHAVESIVRNETGKDKFSDALTEMNKRTHMHGSFRVALLKLYGYASDEPGIRHPLLEGERAKVTERDAIFVLSVCSAFVTYLLADPAG